jgi:hypothetical protein
MLATHPQVMDHGHNQQNPQHILIFSFTLKTTKNLTRATTLLKIALNFVKDSYQINTTLSLQTSSTPASFKWSPSLRFPH